MIRWNRLIAIYYVSFLNNDGEPLLRCAMFVAQKSLSFPPQRPSDNDEGQSQGSRKRGLCVYVAGIINECWQCSWCCEGVAVQFNFPWNQITFRLLLQIKEPNGD